MAGLRFMDEICSRGPASDDVSVVEARKLIDRGRKVRLVMTLAGERITDLRATDAGQLIGVERKVWVRGVLIDTVIEREAILLAHREGFVEESRNDKRIVFMKYNEEHTTPQHDSSDGKKG